jgi:hypothetical protein
MRTTRELSKNARRVTRMGFPGWRTDLVAGQTA